MIISKKLLMAGVCLASLHGAAYSQEEPVGRKLIRLTGLNAIDTHTAVFFGTGGLLELITRGSRHIVGNTHNVMQCKSAARGFMSLGLCCFGYKMYTINTARQPRLGDWTRKKKSEANLEFPVKKLD